MSAAGRTVIATDGTPGNGPGVMVTAADPLRLSARPVRWPPAADAGLGAGVDVDSITKNTQAYIATATVTADGDVLVQAKSAENLTSITGSVGHQRHRGGRPGFGQRLRAGIATRAFIGDDPSNPTSGATNVQAGGSILVAASERTLLDLLSGEPPASGTLSIGAAAACRSSPRRPRHSSGPARRYGALGLGTAIHAENGQFAISYAPYGTRGGVAQPVGRVRT